MEQIVRADELRFFAIYAGMTSTSWCRLIQPLLELEVVR